MSVIKCPKCGESYYMERYTTSTCMYFTPVFKDGVCITNDRNLHTTVCQCLNCGNDFSYQRQGEKIIDYGS